jgi:excinuclease ABC subunit C
MVDGGRGQLGVASALLSDRALALDHIGLAKERDEESASPRVRRSGGLKAERIFLPNRKNPVMLHASSRGLLALQRVRDEAHRFAIEYQRSLRQRIGLTSILEEIPGVGPGKRRALLRELGSLRRVRSATREELAQIAGISAGDAERIAGFFQAVAALAAGPDAGDATGPATTPEGSEATSVADSPPQAPAEDPPDTPERETDYPD